MVGWKWCDYNSPTVIVLVMCQRKTGNTHGVDIEVSLIPALEGFIDTFISQPRTIEYMVDIKKAGNTANHDMRLNKNTDNIYSKQTNDFISTHTEYYDLVVLQTCPGKFIDFKSIYEIMKKDAYMIITAFHADGKMTSVKGMLDMKHARRQQTTFEFIETMFSNESKDHGLYIFKKR